MQTSECPDSVTVERFVRGHLQQTTAEQVKQHILGCLQCSRLVDTLTAGDERTLADETRATADETKGDSLGDWSQERRSRSAEQSQDPELGRVGDYRLMEVIGIGGMGIVYRAEDPKLKRAVALKVMKPEVAASKTARKRFLREAESAARIDHENIVTIYEVGEADGAPFIAMRYLKGESLQKKLKREGRIDARLVANIGRQVAVGLAAAHEQGLIHRDIKPDNIWMEAETGRVKILDFGLARMQETDVRLTRAGVVLGTPKYMSPEQATAGTVDHRSDLFSFGSVLYRLLSGKEPFEGGDSTATLIKVTQAKFDPIEKVCPRLHPKLARLINKLLAKAPGKRPQTARAVAAELTEIETQLQAKHQETARQQQLTDTVALEPPDQDTLSRIAAANSGNRPLLAVAILVLGVVFIALLVYVCLRSQVFASALSQQVLDHAPVDISQVKTKGTGVLNANEGAE